LEIFQRKHFDENSIGFAPPIVKKTHFPHYFLEFFRKHFDENSIGFAPPFSEENAFSSEVWKFFKENISMKIP